MNSAFDAMDVPLTWSALPPTQCPAGPVSTGVVRVAQTATADVGVWEHPAGTSTDVEQDEVFVVLSGSGRILFDDGSSLELRAGTVGCWRRARQRRGSWRNPCARCGSPPGDQRPTYEPTGQRERTARRSPAAVA